MGRWGKNKRRKKERRGEKKRRINQRWERIRGEESETGEEYSNRKISQSKPIVALTIFQVGVARSRQVISNVTPTSPPSPMTTIKRPQPGAASTTATLQIHGILITNTSLKGTVSRDF